MQEYVGMNEKRVLNEREKISRKIQALKKDEEVLRHHAYKIKANKETL